MRKVIVTIDPNEIIKNAGRAFFKQVDTFELVEFLKMDFDALYKIALLKLVLKKGVEIEDVQLPYNSEIISIMKKDKDDYLCLVKIMIPQEFMDITKKFDLDLIFTTPAVIKEDSRTYSAIGTEEDINKFVEFLKAFGEITNLSVMKSAFDKHDLVSQLTDKQLDVLRAAKRYGYYEYPRKINSTQLSEKVGISRATVVEHLRKAEIRIMGSIITDI
jgi:predicted DNA binding protein